MRPTARAGGLSLIAAALGLGCSPPTLDLNGRYPEDTAFVAAAFVDAVGQVVASTGITPFTDQTTSRVETVDADRVYAFAWRVGQLDRLLPSDEALLSEPVRARGQDEPTLPDPAWTGRAEPPGERAEAAPQPFSLTVDWLPRCPTLVADDEEAVVDLRCSSMACGVPFAQRQCQILLELAQCGLGTLVARIDGQGRVAIEDEAGVRPCSPGIVVPPAVATAECGGCQVDVYVRPRAPPPALKTERVVLAPSAPARRESPPYGGALTAMAVSGERVFAAITERCPSDELSVVVVDTESRTITANVPHRGCGPSHLASDGQGGAILVTSTSTSARIVRLRADGLEETSVVVDTDAREPRSLSVSPSGDRIAVLFAGSQDLEDQVVLLSGGLSVLLGPQDFVDAQGGIALRATGDLFIAGDGFIEVFRSSDGMDAGGFLPGTGDGISNDFHRLIPFPSGRVVGVSSNRRSGIHILQDSTAANVGLFFGRAGVLTDALPYPSSDGSPYTGLAAGFSLPASDESEAFLARFAPSEARFLPVSQVFGRGPALDLGIDGKGRLWVRLPAEGVLARVDLGNF